MPREQRKRGRKHKKAAEPEQEDVGYEEGRQGEQDAFGGLSWTTQEPEAGPSHVEQDPNYPFGVLDPDVKAYFRNVDDKLKGWQTGYEDEDVGLVEGEDPNESRRMFLNAALAELNGKELQLATDPECSVILERMMYSMDDFSRRVFLDRLAGAYTQLACHRFASHVCQTLLTLSSHTLSRECRGLPPSLPQPSAEAGELRPISTLIRDAYHELLPHLSEVVMDSFGSHVLGALLILLCGEKIPLNISPESGMVRSKKSAKWRKKQGPMTAIVESAGPPTSSSTKLVPADFPELAVGLVKQLRKMDSNSIRSLAAHKAANPFMQLVLQVEARSGLADEEGSVMDSFLAGMIGELKREEEVRESDYVQTMLRDATASHILEAVLSVAPEGVVSKLWEVYFQGKLPKLAVHPVANFVVAAAITRLGEEETEEMWGEMQGRWGGVLKNNRTGALRAAVTRAGQVGQGEQAVEAVKETFGFTEGMDKTNVVPCILTCLPYSTFKEQKVDIFAQREQTDHPSTQQDPITLQGSLLLQALLHLPTPSLALMLTSLSSLPLPARLSLSHHPISARIIDALLSSPTVPAKEKRAWITSYIGSWEKLVDDRIGSRVGDSCWAWADTFLKEKIARSLIPHEQFLASSHYGRFFARKLRLHLLQRDVEGWKAAQSGASGHGQAGGQPATGWGERAGRAGGSTGAAPAGSAGSAKGTEIREPTAGEGRERKRKRRPEEGDEIDQLFSNLPIHSGKKVRSVVSMPAQARDGEGIEWTETGLDPAQAGNNLFKKSKDKKKQNAGIWEPAADTGTGTELSSRADRALEGVLDVIKQSRTHEKGEERPKKKKKQKREV